MKESLIQWEIAPFKQFLGYFPFRRVLNKNRIIWFVRRGNDIHAVAKRIYVSLAVQHDPVVFIRIHVPNFGQSASPVVKQQTIPKPEGTPLFEHGGNRCTRLSRRRHVPDVQFFILREVRKRRNRSAGSSCLRIGLYCWNRTLYISVETEYRLGRVPFKEEEIWRF